MRSIMVPLGIAAAALVGYAAGSYLKTPKTVANESIKLISECAVLARENIQSNVVRVRCGLDNAGVEEVLRNTLADIGIKDLRGGDIDPEAMKRGADRLGLTNQALVALLGSLRKDANEFDSKRQSNDRPDDFRVALEVTPDTVPKDSKAKHIGESSPSSAFSSRVALAIAPPVTTPEKDAHRLVARCTVQGGTVNVDVIDVDCGPKAEEVMQLIDEVVKKAGVGEIQDILNKDAKARSTFVAELGISLGLADETVDQLLTELAQVNVSDGDIRRQLSDAAEKRARLSLVLLQLGQIADLLRDRQSHAANAIISGRPEEAQIDFARVAQAIRPFADRLDPQSVPLLAASSSLVLEASELASKNRLKEAAFAFRNAAEAALQAGWQPVGAVYRLSSAQMMARAGVLSGDGSMTEYATNTQLAVAKEFSDLALDTALAAVQGLRQQGQQSISNAGLNSALELLRQVAPQVNRGSAPRQFVSLHAGISTVLYELGKRSVETKTLESAASSGQLALDVAEEVGDSGLIANSLIDLGNIQLDLGSRRRDTPMLDAATNAYKRATNLLDPDKDLKNWLASRMNTAVAYRRQSSISSTPGSLDEATEIYRDVLQRVTKESDGNLWATAKGNLAGIFWTQGRQANDVGLLEQALRSYEEILTYHTKDSAPYNWAQTMRSVGGIWKDVGALNRDVKAFDRAVETMTQVISTFDRQTTTKSWAQAQSELGAIYFSWGRLWPNAQRFQMASNAFDEARRVVSPEADPAFYSQQLLMKGKVSLEAAIALQDKSAFDDARNAVHESLQVLKDHKNARSDKEFEWLIKDGTELLSTIELKIKAHQ